MSDYFNQFQDATTAINAANMPQAASAFKNAMLNYKYANMCGWYESLKSATTLNDIFSIFNIRFTPDMVNKKFIPVIQDIYTHAGFKDMLKAIAPYMENGSLYFKDSYRYYVIIFNNGEVTGTRRTITDNNKPEVKEAPKSAPVNAPAPTTPPPTPKKTTKKPTNKGKKKIVLSTPSKAPVTLKRENNTYTVQELVRELLKQMDAGNGAKLVTIEADFLFKNEKYA